MEIINEWLSEWVSKTQAHNNLLGDAFLLRFYRKSKMELSDRYGYWLIIISVTVIGGYVEIASESISKYSLSLNYSCLSLFW